MLSTSYVRVVESTPNGRRSVQVTGRSNGLFTHGNRSHWDSGISRASLNTDDNGMPLPAVTRARRPFRDMPDDSVKIIRQAQVTYCGRGCPIGTLAHTGECW